MQFGRTKDGIFIYIREANTSNKGYFLCYVPNCRNNWWFRCKMRKLKSIYVCWQKSSIVSKIYKRIPRKKKKKLYGR